MIRTTALLAFWIMAAPIAAIIGFPASFVTGNVRILYGLFMWGCRAGIWLAGVRIETVGLERFDRSKSYLFMTNHVSNLDPPIQIPLIPRQTSIMVKQELFKVPILGRAMRMGSLVPVDRGEKARRVIVSALEEMKLSSEASHHEVARGQHEIDLGAADPLTLADHLATLRFVVRTIAVRHGLVATFMPKPIYGRNGSGMHTHQSLFAKGKNAFFDPKGPIQLSEVGRRYIGGLLRHARGYCAITNPLVNSYKRLVPGYEAPINVSWSTQNVSPLIRLPAQRGEATRCENRMPDPSANPYLALAVQLAAGVDGVQEKIDPGEPVNKNIARMSYRERRRFRIDDLPRDLHEALDYLEKDTVVREALGDHIYERYLDAKREEWQEYIGQVSDWELNRYLGQY